MLTLSLERRYGQAPSVLTFIPRRPSRRPLPYLLRLGCWRRYTTIVTTGAYGLRTQTW